MKHIIAAILVGATCLSLAGCGNNTAQKLIGDTFEIGQKALAIEEQFMNGDLDSSSAAEELQDISDELQTKLEDDEEDSGKNNDQIQSLIDSIYSFIEEGVDVESAYESLKNVLSQ